MSFRGSVGLLGRIDLLEIGFLGLVGAVEFVGNLVQRAAQLLPLGDGTGDELLYIVIEAVVRSRVNLGGDQLGGTDEERRDPELEAVVANRVLVDGVHLPRKVTPLAG